MRVIAIANQKGGCGKTTTTVNLAAAFGRHGSRVLVIDLDPQGHTTLGVGCDPESFTKTIYNAIVDLKVPIESVIVPSKAENVDVAPSNVLLSGTELDLATVEGREFMLTEQFKTINDRYDVCIIDCPPSLGILTLNALIASTDVVVPVQVHYYAMEGLKQLFETCEIIQEHFQPCKVKITGLLLTFVEDRLIFTRQIEQQMREFFGDLVFDTVIHRNIRLAEAPSAGQSVITYAPDSKGALEYLALVDEILHGREYIRAAKGDKSDAETSEESQIDSASLQQITEQLTETFAENQAGVSEENQESLNETQTDSIPAEESPELVNEIQTDNIPAEENQESVNDTQTDSIPAEESLELVNDIQTDIIPAEENQESLNETQTDSIPAEESLESVNEIQTDSIPAEENQESVNENIDTVNQSQTDQPVVIAEGTDSDKSAVGSNNG